MDATREGDSAPGASPGLTRSLGSWQAGAFVVSSMVGAGIFTLPAVVREAAGGAPAALGAWLIGGVLALCGALCYAELATRMPEAGGEYRFLHRVYGPAWAFLSGWTSLVVGFSAAMAAASLGAVEYLARVFPVLETGLPLPGEPDPRGLLAATLILVLARVHGLGVGVSGRLQAALAGAVVLGLAGLVAAAVLSGHGEASRLMTAESLPGGWWVALLQVSFAYSGWNAAAYLAGEAREPTRTLPRALVGGTGLVVVAYLAFNAVVLAVVPAAARGGDLAVGHALVERTVGAGGAAVASLLVALAILGSVSAMSAAGPRVYFAMAGDGLAPGALGRLDARRAPRTAIRFQAGVAAALALTGAFEALLVYIGSSLLLFSSSAVLAVVLLRRRHGPAGVGFRVPLYPIPVLVFLGLASCVWIVGLGQRPVPMLAGLATVGAGWLLYRLAGKRHPDGIGVPAPSSE